ncbi:hypothetical protein DV736_g1263, partial [Chaetothyriales sp. CBS 134916]
MPALPEETRSENPQAEAMPPFARWLSLDKYLRAIRFSADDPASRISPTTVIGNPSADLDSFVSAVVYSYFHNHSEPQTKNAKTGANIVYIPLLNLPKTPASKLHRLRPEFDLAIRSALAWHIRDDDSSRRAEGIDSTILDQVITIHDLTTTFSSSPLASSFTPTSEAPPSQPVPVVLVDHNVPSMIGFTPDELSSRLTVTGCIDHHVDESSSPQSYTPRIINLNAGSCTSLVISYLRSQNLFPDPSPNPQTNPTELSSTIALQQISSLALSSILVDTHNLKSSSRTKPVDLEAVQFLTSHLTKPGLHGGTFTPPSLNSNKMESASASAIATFFTHDYYRILSDAKINSLKGLNLEEILDRDYKQWSEPSDTAKTTFVEIGIASAPQPISWLVDHASSHSSSNSNSSNFVSAISNFSKSNNLDIFLLLTSPTLRGKGLAAVALTDRGAATLERFEKRALGLEAYDEEKGRKELTEAMDAEFRGKDGQRQWRVWWLTKMDITRKQIAPLVRECVKQTDNDTQ